jgi:ubiquinol-cytochrome c reductase cytochrome b subunit
MPNGAFVEIHQPLGPVDEHGHPIPLPYGGAAVPKQMNQLGFSGHPGRGGAFKADSPEIARRAAEIEHANHAEEAEMLRNLNEANRAKDQENGLKGLS